MRKLPALQRALKAGRQTYEGAPCKNCEGTQRYTSSRRCIRCSNESSRRYVQYPNLVTEAHE